MARIRKNPLRELLEDEKIDIEKLCRSRTLMSSVVARAKIIKAIHEGHTYQEAAHLAGRRSYQAVSQLVAKFNQKGVKSLYPEHGGGANVVYTPKIRQKIIDIVSADPDRKQDGTATWSLSALQNKLKKTEIGHVSTYTLWKILHEADFSFQRNRTWIKTGVVNRKRKGKMVEVEDPDAEVKKKSNFSSL